MSNSNIFDKIAPAQEYAAAVGSTQEHLLIKAIHDDIVLLKDGTLAAVLQTSAVNFDLLSENEQLAIIASFAGLLNSLSFAIQIVIRSKRLDVTDYLTRLNSIEQQQQNPLLKQMMKSYRTFVETLTSENEVLDKQFYVVIPVSYLEIGVLNNLEKDLPKALTVLRPRVDHIIKQLGRIGLKAEQISTEKLVKLFYDIYNESYEEQDIRTYVDKTVAENQKAAPEKPVQKQTPLIPQMKPEPQTAPTPEPKPAPTQAPPQAIAPRPEPQEQAVPPETTTYSPPPTQTVITPTPSQDEAYAHKRLNTFDLEPLSEHSHHLPKEHQTPSGLTPLFGSKPVEQVHEGQTQTETSANHPVRPQTPFVVEELSDDYGSAS